MESWALFPLDFCLLGITRDRGVFLSLNSEHFVFVREVPRSESESNSLFLPNYLYIS